MPRLGPSKFCKSIRAARKKVATLLTSYVMEAQPVPLDAGPELTEEECEVIRALIQALQEICPAPVTPLKK